MSRKTEALYFKVFQKMQELMPQFSPLSAMADFEEASVSAFRRVFGDVTVTGCFTVTVNYFCDFVWDFYILGTCSICDDELLIMHYIALTFFNK